MHYDQIDILCIPIDYSIAYTYIMNRKNENLYFRQEFLQQCM